MYSRLLEDGVGVRVKWRNG